MTDSSPSGVGHPETRMSHETGTSETWRPDFAPPPGFILQKELAARGLTQAELALRTGLSPKHVNQVIKGLVPLSAEMALLLERVLGTPSHVWNGLEAEYRGVVIRNEARKALEKYSEWFQKFPIAELIKRNILTKSDDVPTKVERILSFFGVADPDTYERVWNEPIAAFRRTTRYGVDPFATAMWLRLAENEAADLHLATFDSKAFHKLVPDLRRLTTAPLAESFPVLQRLCAQSGVAVVRIQEVPGTRACGATRWINALYPIIILSGRYRVEDSLWFSFFHEAGHVILHPKRATYIKPESNNDDQNEFEDQADQFSRNTLIPSELSGQLAQLSRPEEIRAFAQQIGVDAGIVAGRLMNDGLLPWSYKCRRRISD